MAYRTDDPIADFERWDADQNRRLAQLPECDKCEEPIQQEKAHYINGELLCEHCLEDHRKEVPRGKRIVCSECGARIRKEYYEINNEPVCMACSEICKMPITDFI